MAAYLVHSIPYRHMQRAVQNAATGFVQAGLRVDLNHEARLVAEAERWECAVQAEVDEPWWEKWDVPDQRSFLDDMRDLEEQYDRWPPHIGVPEHMVRPLPTPRLHRPHALTLENPQPDLAEPRLVCWTTLQRMREVSLVFAPPSLLGRSALTRSLPQQVFSRIQVVQQVVHEIARSPPPGTDARLWAQNTGDWFQLGFLDLIKPADFHLADVKLRRQVVVEFERVDKHLLELYKQGRSASLVRPLFCFSAPWHEPKLT